MFDWIGRKAAAQAGGEGGGRAKNVFRFPGSPMRRHKRGFRRALARLRAVLSQQKELPVQLRQALVVELGTFEAVLGLWGGKLSRGVGSSVEFARRVLLVDYRLSALKILAGSVDASLRDALRQYAEASAILLEATARRGPDGEPIEPIRRTEIEALLKALD